MPEQGPTPALCCSYCGKPASCIGKADDGHGWAYACDECCGHGNEDSCCYPLSRIPAEWNRRDEVEEKAEKEEDAARARHLREAVEGMPSINAPEADFVCVEWMSERGYPFRVTMPRAALLAALTKGNE